MISERTLLSFLVGAGVLYTIGYIGLGPEYPKMSKDDLAAVQGCYSVSGRPLLRIVGSTILSGRDARGFKATREKSYDVLVMDSPVQISWEKGPSLVTAGTASKVGISYGQPVSLMFFDGNDREVAAVKSPCTDEYSRPAV